MASQATSDCLSVMFIYHRPKKERKKVSLYVEVMQTDWRLYGACWLLSWLL
jgi:hypothetical protein